MSKKARGTSGLMPTRGSGCGIRPNAEALDTLEQGDGIDFTRAKDLLDHDKLNNKVQEASESIPAKNRKTSSQRN